jgi:hypothetical protein
MATQIITNAAVTINSVNISARVKMVKVSDTAMGKPDTAMGATYETTKFAGALKQAKVDVTFYQDRGTTVTTGVDILLAPLVGSTASYSVVVLSAGTTIGATNPRWTLSEAQLASDYQAIGGSVGDLEEFTVSFVPGSGGTLVRATS